jgi:hypothetical protein
MEGGRDEREAEAENPSHETEGSSWCRPVATDQDYRDIGIDYDYDEPSLPTHILSDYVVFVMALVILGLDDTRSHPVQSLASCLTPPAI